MATAVITVRNVALKYCTSAFMGITSQDSTICIILSLSYKEMQLVYSNLIQGDAKQEWSC